MTEMPGDEQPADVDVEVAPAAIAEIDEADKPITSDPAAMTDTPDDLGGTAGPDAGGAG
ncbi:MAG: hypothetical protein LC640_11950 [Frankia sp.]|nr:hypothetical protein [Frankia sp.]